MNFSRKALYILVSILLLIVGGIWFAKKQLLQTHPENAPVITQKEKTPLDLRPAAIAKLQQLVESGSDSLYQLGIDSLLTDIESGTLILKGISVQPDSSVIRRMERQKRLPDDVFHITLQSLRITGIGLSDLVNRRDISLQSIACTNPQITVQHRRQTYNADKRAAEKGKSLFSRLKGQIDRLAIDSISITGGSFNDKNGGTINTYKDFSIALRDVLIDSAAELDPTRFLFAKVSLLQAGKISIPAGKSQYDLSIGGIAISGEKQQLRIQNLAVKPHSGKAQFLRNQTRQIEVYELTVPAIIFNGIDWWAAAHGESLIAKETELTGAQIYIYLDQRLPSSGKIKRDNFPQQLLSNMEMPLSLKEVKVKETTLIYEEFTRASGKQSSITFNRINAVAKDFTNLPAEVAAHPTAHFKGTCQFMNATQLSAAIELALPDKKKGAFSADLAIKSLTPEIVNPFAEAMGLLRIKSGELQYAKAHVAGNNNAIQGTIAAAYTNLHIMPLKPSDEKGGALRKKRIVGKIANVLLVKNNNPAKGKEIRQPDFKLERGTEPNFFNFIWMGISQGMLKTIGVPPNLAP